MPTFSSLRSSHLEVYLDTCLWSADHWYATPSLQSSTDAAGIRLPKPENQIPRELPSADLSKGNEPIKNSEYHRLQGAEVSDAAINVAHECLLLPSHPHAYSGLDAPGCLLRCNYWLTYVSLGYTSSRLLPCCANDC